MTAMQVLDGTQILPSVLAAASEYRLDDGLSVRFTVREEMVDLTVHWRPSSRWRVLEQLQREDPARLSAWLTTLVQQLNRMVEEGIPAMQLPWPGTELG